MNGKRGFGGGGRGKTGGQGQQGKDGQRRPMFRRRKVCKFCADKIDDINYKDVKLLGPFVPEHGSLVYMAAATLLHRTADNTGFLGGLLDG